MATTNDSPDGLTEPCDACATDTIHEVSIQLKTESADSENAEFSREPYRVTECLTCGHRTSQRMNNV
jgi:hypothetical protein